MKSKLPPVDRVALVRIVAWLRAKRRSPSTGPMSIGLVPMTTPRPRWAVHVTSWPRPPSATAMMSSRKACPRRASWATPWPSSRCPLHSSERASSAASRPNKGASTRPVKVSGGSGTRPPSPAAGRGKAAKNAPAAAIRLSSTGRDVSNNEEADRTRSASRTSVSSLALETDTPKKSVAMSSSRCASSKTTAS